MRIVLVFIILLGTVQSLPNTSGTTGWRGIVPLHSTRSEVEKLLGPSTDTRPGSALYRTKDAVVMVFYSDGDPCGTKDSQWRVPPNTVIAIYVTLSPGRPLSQFNLDETKYKKKSGGHRPEDIYYTNDERGEVLRVFNGEVLDLHYSPASSDKHLRCAPKQ